PTTLGEAFSLARIAEARSEESVKNRFGPSKYEDPGQQSELAMEKALSDQAFASPYKVAEIVHKLLHSLKKSKNHMVHGMVRGEFASPMARGLESKGVWGESYLSYVNKVYINLEGNRSHIVTTGWAMLGLIDAKQIPDSYLFFECDFPKEVWCRIKTMARLEHAPNSNGRIGSKVALQQLVEPAIVPPPPISWYLRGITTRKVEMMINDLLDEAARIKGVSATESNIHQELSSNELKLDEITDDKER
ncbi:ribonuclease H-like domain-containing protein, partial [Tanacetum coccineum]